MSKMKYNRMRFGQNFFMICGAVLFLMGMAAVPIGVFNIGSVLLCLLGGFLWLTVLLERKTGRKQRMLTTLGVIALTGLFAHAVIWNYFAWCRPPQQTGEATMVVLGCKVNGEEPSLMLRRRLECAMEYLAENPQADCVVSGGMGDNESYTEAHVMKKFLVEHGIDAERVYEEDRSTSTETNLLYSLALVKEEDLSQNIILCTDGFHQLRAWMYGMRNGVDARAISGRTPVLTIPSYAVRELGGILKMLILG